MTNQRIELHEFLKLVLHYYRHSSPWTKTYDEMVRHLLELSKCKTLLEAVEKAKIDRGVPDVVITTDARLEEHLRSRDQRLRGRIAQWIEREGNKDLATKIRRGEAES